ncbi:MAG: hypothetical protein CMJ81_22175 [Planctomycetaceae bacterium]|nr:hypothetical protein [Planctomycetaceae bacterium]MBP63200.1 hypothetical protein [Planctomycetaceae bacterium]
MQRRSLRRMRKGPWRQQANRSKRAEEPRLEALAGLWNLARTDRPLRPQHFYRQQQERHHR